MLSGPFNLKQTKTLLVSLSHSPKKWLGQNFLIDGNIVKKSLELAEVTAGDNIVEVGPGLGTLSTTLLQAGVRLFAVEKDATLAAHLRENLAPAYSDKFYLTEGDAMEFPLAKIFEHSEKIAQYKIIANLPYAISSPWMDKVLEQVILPKQLVLMVQQEAADRFMAQAGSKNFGALSIFISAAYERKQGHTVSPNCFFPPPKVNSYLLNLKQKDSPIIFAPDCKKIIRKAFIYRRKQISSEAKRIESPAQVEVFQAWLTNLKTYGCDTNSRPEEIPLDAWLNLNENIIKL